MKSILAITKANQPERSVETLSMFCVHRYQLFVFLLYEKRENKIKIIAAFLKK